MTNDVVLNTDDPSFAALLLATRIQDATHLRLVFAGLIGLLAERPQLTPSQALQSIEVVAAEQGWLDNPQ